MMQQILNFETLEWAHFADAEGNFPSQWLNSLEISTFAVCFREIWMLSILPRDEN